MSDWRDEEAERDRRVAFYMALILVGTALCGFAALVIRSQVGVAGG
jgi:hypothetical protein